MVKKSKTALQIRLADLIATRGVSVNEASMQSIGKLGVIRDIISGRTKNPGYLTLQPISRYLGVSVAYLTGESDNMDGSGSNNVVSVEVAGSVSAGTWVELDELQQEATESVEAIVDSRFPRMKYTSFKVSGDSMDKVAPDGAHVICVPWADTGLEPTDGAIVVCQQSTAGGSLIERTIKRLRRVKTKWVLEPMSSNPKHKVIEFNGDTEVSILALVIQVTKKI